MNRALALVVLLAAVPAAAALPKTNQCLPFSSTDAVDCGRKRSGWLCEKDTGDCHFMLNGVDWLELDPSGTTLTIVSDQGTLLVFSDDVQFSGALTVDGVQTFTGDLSLGGGAGALTCSDGDCSLLLQDNDQNAFVVGAAGALDILQIDTQDATPSVMINGVTSTLAFQVVTGTAEFDETVKITGGAGALEFDNTGATMVINDNDATAYGIGSTGKPRLLNLDTTDDNETVVVAGTAATDALHVDVGTAQFDEAVTIDGLVTTKPWFSTTFGEGVSKGVSNLKFDGTAFSLTADHVNVISYGANGDRYVFETITTAAGNCTPTGAAAGLDLCIGVGAADEWVLTAGGEFGTNGGLIIPGTTPPWKACATATIADISTIAAAFLIVSTPGVPVVLGSSDPNYTSYAAIGALVDENITVSDNTTGPTDTTDNWGDTEQHKVCIIDAAGDGVITYEVDDAPPTSTDAHTLSGGVPHVVRWQELAGTGPGVVTLDELSLGPP
jgi:hypothetical protein